VRSSDAARASSATNRAEHAPSAGAGELHFEGLPPLSLYVHLPWCVRKCPYCDFNSYEVRGVLPDDDYVAAVLRDLESERPLLQGRRIETVFIGGGTPSLFSGAAIARLIDGIALRTPLVADAEITLEANPGAVDAERFAAFRRAGVNRLSIGVQSFRDEKLRTLGRVHDAAAVGEAVGAARAAGFENFNLDLMYGLPGDDASGALGDLEAALDLDPPHLSWYQLTLEPNTAFARKPPPLPDDDRVAEIERAGRALLAAHGLARYEISAYSRPGYRCRHNLNYWQFGDYLGLGAGAHGKVTRLAEQCIERRVKPRNPRTYLDRASDPAAVAVERVSRAPSVALEFLLNALRLVGGVDEETLVARAGQRAQNLAAGRAAGLERGWLEPIPGRWCATAAGLEHLNPLLTLFA